MFPFLIRTRFDGEEQEEKLSAASGDASGSPWDW
jgi:hypothetical protein